MAKDRAVHLLPGNPFPQALSGMAIHVDVSHRNELSWTRQGLQKLTHAARLAVKRGRLQMAPSPSEETGFLPLQTSGSSTVRWDRCYLTLRVAAKVNREDSETVVANPVKNLLCAQLGIQEGSKRL